MTFSRGLLGRPIATREDTLFHYCRTDSFAAIISSKSIRLSALSLSNDSLEGKVARAVLLSMLSETIKQGHILEALRAQIAIFDIFDGLGFCLSEGGDVLSQWRGYADDGRGVSIGFSKRHLRAISDADESEERFSLHKVQYLPTDHRSLLTEVAAEIQSAVDRGWGSTAQLLAALATPPDDTQAAAKAALQKAVDDALWKVFPLLFRLKAEAFKEEQEWRLLTHVLGAKGCEFRGFEGRLVPFKTYNLLAVSGTPINKVVLGPKHVTPVSVVEGMLAGAGFGDVEVIRSTASYQ